LCTFVEAIHDFSKHGLGRTHPWVVPLGTTSRNGQEIKNNQICFWAFLIKYFHNYKLLLFHVYQISCSNIWLEVYMGI
jgi:hypothetical protein